MDLMQYEQIEEEHKDDIAKVMRYLWILWWLGFSSLPVLVIMSFIIGGRLQQQTEGTDLPFEIIIPVFCVIAAGSQIAAVVLRNLFLSGKMDNYLKRTQKFNSGKDPDHVVLCRNGLYIPAVVSSVPAFMGFPLFVMGVTPWLFYTFVILGAAGMIYHRPQKDLIVEYIFNEQNTH
ncbi:MAG: hypothetical protein JW912_07845 [Sedimentisphaerales bacterium]|nr:hypothetical protein [Sedimentisphaerales bacterium]